MNAANQGWFSEIQNDLWPGQCFSYKVKDIIYQEQSQHQLIQIFETETYGTSLVLDGIIQNTSRDEFSYQEMISFLPLCCHPKPRKVLIIGGGDGGVAREVVKHPDVVEVHQVEIDDRVIDLSKQYLPKMACGFNSPKLRLTIGDGLQYMKQHSNEFDVIITDSSDPIGPAVSLFQEGYYEVLKNALRRGGIVSSQGGCFWLDQSFIKKVMTGAKQHFTQVAYAVTSVPSYPCGTIGFVIGSLDSNRPLRGNPLRQFTDKELDKMDLKYYSPAMHRACFTLPRYIEKDFYGF